jgi:catechol 2,3-dioxygenase-like lactoylglutathione lyase family enzyme
MSIEVNHIIIPATDKAASARFLADILGVEAGAPWGPFWPVQVGPVTLDFGDATDIRSMHVAFLVDDATFDTACQRLRDTDAATYADPFRRQPGQINHRDGGRGIYFDDPDGHYFELITAPYGSAAGADTP